MRTPVILDDEWNMGIPLKVPMAVHCGRFLCLRGQVDLDPNAQARNPGNILAQTDACARHILDTLAAAEPNGPWTPRLLAVYIVPGPGKDIATVETLLRERLPGGSTLPIAIVPIPWLYYPGIDIEIDLIASRAEDCTKGPVSLSGFDGFAGHGADISFLAGSVDAGADLRAICATLLDDLPAEARLQVFVQAGSRAACDAVVPPELPDVEVIRCIIPEMDEIRITLQAMAAPKAERIIDENGIVVRQFGEVAVLDTSGRAPGAADSPDLPGQTREMMQRTEAALASISLDFGHVLKGTVFYVGDNTDEALYSNLRVRDGYYAHPGPASTGVPFAEPSDAGSMIRMSLFLSTLRKDQS